jgi:hypothetical protein
MNAYVYYWKLWLEPLEVAEPPSAAGQTYPQWFHMKNQLPMLKTSPT